MAHVCGELDRMLRVHRITDLGPLLRRSLLSTWFLPDQASALLDVWDVSPEAICPLRLEARRAMSVLPKFFPASFMSSTNRIFQHIEDKVAEDSHAALVALGMLGKSVQNGNYCIVGHEIHAHRCHCVDVLTRALVSAVEEPKETSASLCRRVVHSVSLLRAEDASMVRSDLLQWSKEHVLSRDASPVALRVAAACVEQSIAESRQVMSWLAEIRKSLLDDDCQQSVVLQAFVELLAAVGDEWVLCEFLADSACDAIAVCGVVAALRAVRRGTLPLSPKLLSTIALRIYYACTRRRRWKYTIHGFDVDRIVQIHETEE